MGKGNLRQRLIGTARRELRETVLYLMIASMPTEEMAEAVAIKARA